MIILKSIVLGSARRWSFVRGMAQSGSAVVAVVAVVSGCLADSHDHRGPLSWPSPRQSRHPPECVARLLWTVDVAVMRTGAREGLACRGYHDDGRKSRTAGCCGNRDDRHDR
jgi:hypothetical protein